ncbi:MAG: inorganic pyrophosphatase, partial [Phenylobacterium sp.]|nr:inorganic pyrophosphatase [Phenylobacterium sp.]
FFQHYKDLEKGQSVEIVRWADPDETGELIRQGIELNTKVEAEKAAAKLKQLK